MLMLIGSREKWLLNSCKKDFQELQCVLVNENCTKMAANMIQVNRLVGRYPSEFIERSRSS